MLFFSRTIGSDFARGPECWQARVREWGGGLRQRWLGGALAPVTSAGLQQRSARHRHGRHRGQYTAAPSPVAAHQRGTSTRSWQVFYPEPFSPGILVKHLSNTAKNQFNQQRERAHRAAADINLVEIRIFKKNKRLASLNCITFCLGTLFVGLLQLMCSSNNNVFSE